MNLSLNRNKMTWKFEHYFGTLNSEKMRVFPEMNTWNFESLQRNIRETCTKNNKGAQILRV